MWRLVILVLVVFSLHCGSGDDPDPNPKPNPPDPVEQVRETHAAPVAGGGTIGSPGYSLTLNVGPVQPVGRSESAGFSIVIGPLAPETRRPTGGAR